MPRSRNAYSAGPSENICDRNTKKWSQTWSRKGSDALNCCCWGTGGGGGGGYSRRSCRGFNFMSSCGQWNSKNHSEASHGLLKVGVLPTTVLMQLFVHAMLLYTIIQCATAEYGASGAAVTACTVSGDFLSISMVQLYHRSRPGPYREVSFFFGGGGGGGVIGQHAPLSLDVWLFSDEQSMYMYIAHQLVTLNF